MMGEEELVNDHMKLVDSMGNNEKQENLDKALLLFTWIFGIFGLTTLVLMLTGLIFAFCMHFNEILKKQPVEVICTWDIPAEYLESDLPPLPVSKP